MGRRWSLYASLRDRYEAIEVGYERYDSERGQISKFFSRIQAWNLIGNVRSKLQISDAAQVL